jgi:hypothetical protein
MLSIHVLRLSPRSRAFLGGAALLLLPGCPGEDTPLEDTSSSSGASGSTTGTPTTNPPDDTTTSDPPCGTGGCGEEDTTASSGSSGSTSTTEGTGSSTTTEGAGSSSGESSSGGTTEGVSAGSSSSGGEFETGVVFIVEPEVGAGMDCDPWLQDCPVGEKCNPWDSSGGGSWDANACFPVDPFPVGVGETCTVVGSGTSGIDDCEAGAMCWDVDAATNEGTCVALCTGSPMAPMCAAGSSCVITNGGVLTLCLPGCDPLAQDCGAGQGCYFVGADFICVPDASGGQGVDGDGCEFINVCDPGLMCIDAGSVQGCLGGTAGCCTPYCDITVPGDPCPAAAEECVPFFDPGMAPLGLEDVGVCAIPV